MTDNIVIGLRLAGANMSPGKLRSKEIAELIESIEEMTASVVVSDDPKIKKDSIVVGLKAIKEGSIGLEFAPNLVELTMPATFRITRSIADNDFGTLPSSTMTALRKLSGFSRRHQCDVEFFAQNGNVQNLATITPDTQIPNTYAFIGETTLYGVINRVGGAEPKIQFKTFDGQLLYCSTTQEIAKQAGNRLYKQVGLEGRAEWNSETLRIENFYVSAISNYEKVSPSVAFEELSRLVGDSFDEIIDVDSFVAEIRYGGAEA